MVTRAARNPVREAGLDPLPELAVPRGIYSRREFEFTPQPVSIMSPAPGYSVSEAVLGMHMPVP